MFLREIRADQIVFDTGFRKLCEVNACRSYGTNYMCPPHIGGAEECIANVKRYSGGILVQSVIQLEDSFDFEGMIAGQKEHDRRMRELAKEDCLILGAGPCPLCNECGAVKGTPCPRPAEAVSSVEAHCIDVMRTLANVGLKYNNGESTVSYVGLILF